MAGRGIGEIAKKYGIAPERIVKLGSNENPYGPSPRVREAIASAPLNLYPETEELISAFASYTGFPEREILIGTGMDGVIDTLARLFLEDGYRSLILTPTFSFYEIVTTICGAESVFMRRGAKPGLPPGFLEAATDPRVRMVFICSPNNPTGGVIDETELCSVLNATDATIFLDEAYIDFAEKSLVELVRRYDNLVVGRTMSKAFGLAGLRLGYAVAPEWISDQYRRTAPPFFGVTTASAAAGVAALEDLDHMRQSVRMIRRERDRLVRKIPGAGSPQGNFIYLDTAEPSAVVAEKMLQRGVIIRDCRSFRDAGDNHIRVTVGTPDQNDRFMEAYGEVC